MPFFQQNLFRSSLNYCITLGVFTLVLHVLYGHIPGVISTMAVKTKALQKDGQQLEGVINSWKVVNS